jgi:hypothetical protein
VVIIDSDEWNASAPGEALFVENDGRHTTPYVFFYNKGFFVDGITDAQITMVTAHELGHLILRNGSTPDDFQDVFYRETAADRGKIYGEYEKNDPEVQDLAQRVQNSADRVGLLVAPELHGFPTKIGARIPANAYVQAPLYSRMVQVLYDKYAASSEHPADCAAAPDKGVALSSLVESHITVDSKLDLGTDGANVDAAALAYETALTSCLSHVTGTFAQALELLKEQEDPQYATNIAAVGTDSQKLATYLQISDTEIDADSAFPDMNPVQKILQLGTAQMSGLSDAFVDPKIKYSELRDYTLEDDSDEAAVRVAKLIGVDSDELVKAIFLGLGAPFAATAQSCRDLLASGGAPDYGGAGDPHHGNCWRAYRNSKLKIALQSCSAGWPSTP